MESGRDDLEQGVWLDCGVRVKPVYVAGDVQAADHPVGMPGAFPFTRGLSPGRPKDDPWVIRVYAGFGTPEDSNERFRRLVAWGAEEIQMAVDLPTQVGYDSDHIMSTGEVGRVGVAIDSLHDMEVLFEGIPLDRLRCVGMLGNSFGPTALALFIALGEKLLLQKMIDFPQVIEQAAHDLAPHQIAVYLRDFAGDFHSYYNASRFLVEDERIKLARLALIAAIAQVLRNGLALLGVTAPEQM